MKRYALSNKLQHICRAGLIAGLLMLPGFLVAQCQLIDDYSDPGRWTQVGTLMEVTAGSAVFLEGCPDGEQRRIHAPIGATLFSESTFTADIDFEVIDIGDIPVPSVGHILIALTAGTQDPLSDCPDIPCTGNPPGTQDGIMVMYATPDTGVGEVHFKIVVKNGKDELVSDAIFNGVLDTWFYLRLERPLTTQVRLSIYSDPARTKEIDGSPVVLDIPESVGGLTHVQHGNVARWNPERQLLGKVDNLCLEYAMTSSVDDRQAASGIGIYPNPVSSLLHIDGGGPVDVVLYDLQGAPLMRSYDVRSMHLSGIAAGTYLLEVRSPETIVVERVVKL